VLLCRGEAALHAARLREPQAPVLAAGAAIDLAQRQADSVTVVDLAMPSVDAAARQHHLEQRALAVLRSPDE
jgi:hypothetical protein